MTTPPDIAQRKPPPALRTRAREAYEAQARETRENEWILEYLPLVRHVVQKVAAHLGRRFDREDLISAGTLGLVRAARAYDPTRHAEFKTYAYIRIRGAVIDELRSLSHRTVSVHRQIGRIQEAYDALMSAEGRAPSDEAVAERAGLTIDAYYHTVEEARRQHFLSIHGLSDDAPTLENLIPADACDGPDREAERREMVARLTRAIQELPERDRRVVLLYYEQDLNMKEIAAVLEVTESRVSQMHASALWKLSLKLRSPR